jgi:hypothetical protein
MEGGTLVTIGADHPFAHRSLNALDESGLEGCATCGRPRSVHPGTEVEQRRAEVPAVPFSGQRRTGGYGYPSSRRAGELSPEWVMVGVDVAAGKRLYASKDLKDSAFELAVDAHLNGEGWRLGTVMQQMLVITKPTYAECLAELMTIWRNWENAGRELPPASQQRRAL